MLVLGIESSTNVASVAIGDETGIIGQMTLNTPRTHSQKLMPLIESLFNELGVTIKDIDVIGVTTGPGSFTGIRIGLSVAKALAHPRDIPIVSLTTLQSLAYNMSMNSNNLLAIVKANRSSVYAGGYSWNGLSFANNMTEGNYALAELLDLVDVTYEDFTVVGQLDDDMKGQFISRFGDRVQFPLKSHVINSAVSIVTYVLTHLDEKQSFYDIEATYYKLSEAEETLLKKREAMNA